MSGPARTAGWFAVLTVGLAALRLADTAVLATPPSASVGDLTTWIDDRGAAVAAMALVRLGSELALWYVLAVSALHVATRVSGLRGIAALADALTVPVAARLMSPVIGMSLAVAAVPATAGQSDEVGTAVMRPVDGPVGAGTATMVPTASPVAEATDPPVAPDPPVEPVAGRHVQPTTWRVEEGDSFWSIAVELLGDRWQREPTDREVGPYWRALVAANQDRLVVRGEPDLVLPGQVFELPAVPAAG